MGRKHNGPQTLHKYECALHLRAFTDNGSSRMARMHAARYFKKVLTRAFYRGKASHQQVVDGLLQLQGMVGALSGHLLVPDLQMECAHVAALLTDKCSAQQMDQMMQTGLLQSLVTLLQQMQSHDVWVHATCAVIDFAIHNPQPVIDCDYLPLLIHTLSTMSNNDQIFDNEWLASLSLALSSLCCLCLARDQVDSPPFHSFVPVLPSLTRLLRKRAQLPDKQLAIVIQALHTLASTTTTHEQLGTYMDTVDCGLVVQCLQDTATSTIICTVALKLLHKLLDSANNEQRTHLLSLDLLPALKHSICSYDSEVRQWAFKTLFRVILGPNEHLGLVLNDRAIMIDMMKALYTDCPLVSIDSAWMVLALGLRCTAEQRHVLMTEHGLLNALLHVFANKDWHQQHPMFMLTIVRCVDIVLQLMHNPAQAMRLLVEPHLRDQTDVSAAVRDECERLMLKYYDASHSPAPPAHNYYTLYTRPNHAHEQD